MTFEEAWRELGRDPDRILATIKSVPRDERVAAAEKILDKAKRMAARASAPHHPDVGGDPVKFRRAWEALSIIEKWTDGFKAAAEEARRRRETPRVGTFIKICDPTSSRIESDE